MIENLYVAKWTIYVGYTGLFDLLQIIEKLNKSAARIKSFSIHQFFFCKKGKTLRKGRKSRDACTHGSYVIKWLPK